MLSLITYLVWWTCTVSATAFSFSTIPPFVPVCNRSDPNLNDCVTEAITSLKDRVPDGIPELYIPPLEPLLLPELKFDQNSGTLFLHSTYKNIEVWGLSNFTVSDVNIDLDNLTLSAKFNVPNIEVNAKYVMNGKIMMMPLIGEGGCQATFTDVEATCNISGSKVERNEQVYLKLEDLQVSYKVGHSTIFLDNLFNGDAGLGQRMNNFLNDNWDSLAEDIRPSMERAIANVIRSSISEVLKDYSYDELLPE